MNAIRDIETAEEIAVRLQTNEVLVHLPRDTPLGSVPDKIYEAGFKPDGIVCLMAEGVWTTSGFLPNGWAQALPAERPTEAADGLWQLCFERQKDKAWVFSESKKLEVVPQIKDEGR